jgi:tetratricopeptide (TPR) repeat protein
MALATSYLNLGKLEKAAQIYADVLEMDPGNLQAHSDLAYILASQDRPAEAIPHYEYVVSSSPSDVINTRNLTLLYRDTGRFDQAVEQARRLVEIAPDEQKGESYYLLGLLYDAAGQPEQANAAFEQADALGYSP